MLAPARAAKVCTKAFGTLRWRVCPIWQSSAFLRRRTHVDSGQEGIVRRRDRRSGAAQDLAAQGHHALQAFGKAPHKGEKPGVKAHRIQSAEQTRERVTTGNAVTQAQRGAKAVLFSLAEQSHVGAVFGPVQHTKAISRISPASHDGCDGRGGSGSSTERVANAATGSGA